MRFPRFNLRELMVGIAAWAVLAAVGSCVYNAIPNSVTRSEIAQLKTGMRRDEVIEILGSPDNSDVWVRDGKRYERWDYGIWGWLATFEDDRFVHAEPF